MAREPFKIFINVWNILMGAIFIAAGIFGGWGSFGSIVSSVTIMAFGIVTIVVELKPPAILITLFGWFRWWIGRGVFYVVMGVFCGVPGWNNGKFEWRWFFGIIPIVTGIIYCILQFVGPKLPGPMMGGTGYQKI